MKNFRKDRKLNLVDKENWARVWKTPTTHTSAGKQAREPTSEGESKKSI